MTMTIFRFNFMNLRQKKSFLLRNFKYKISGVKILSTERCKRKTRGQNSVHVNMFITSLHCTFKKCLYFVSYITGITSIIKGETFTSTNKLKISIKKEIYLIGVLAKNPYVKSKFINIAYKLQMYLKFQMLFFMQFFEMTT